MAMEAECLIGLFDEDEEILDQSFDIANASFQHAYASDFTNLENWQSQLDNLSLNGLSVHAVNTVKNDTCVQPLSLDFSPFSIPTLAG